MLSAESTHAVRVPTQRATMGFGFALTWLP